MSKSEIPKEVCRLLGLVPLPREGGWAREVRDNKTEGMRQLPSNMGITASSVEKMESSSILYMLESGQVSKWHMVEVDEYWCYHAGGTIRFWQYFFRALYDFS